MLPVLQLQWVWCTHEHRSSGSKHRTHTGPSWMGSQCWEGKWARVSIPNQKQSLVDSHLKKDQFPSVESPWVHKLHFTAGLIPSSKRLTQNKLKGIFGDSFCLILLCLGIFLTLLVICLYIVIFDFVFVQVLGCVCTSVSVCVCSLHTFCLLFYFIFACLLSKEIKKSVELNGWEGGDEMKEGKPLTEYIA